MGTGSYRPEARQRWKRKIDSTGVFERSRQGRARASRMRLLRENGSARMALAHLVSGTRAVARWEQIQPAIFRPIKISSGTAFELFGGGRGSSSSNFVAIRKRQGGSGSSAMP